MAKYKELWDNETDQNIIGYKDTETGAFIPIDPANTRYKDVQAWLQSNTADPQYTQTEIDIRAVAQQEVDAEDYLTKTAAIVQAYRDALAAGALSPIPESKYKMILHRRRRAARKMKKTVDRFNI